LDKKVFTLGKNFKSQNPNLKIQTNLKNQYLNKFFDHLNLRFGTYLEFGAWNLGFFLDS
jgi:hypothetical protein